MWFGCSFDRRYLCSDVCYRFKHSCFIFVCDLAQNLCPIDEGGFRDPLVRLILSPEVDNRKREAIISRGEHHPYFDQHFKFPVSRDQLPGKELIMQVMDCDRYSQNDAMGEVRINIDEMDLTKSVEVCFF